MRMTLVLLALLTVPATEPTSAAGMREQMAVTDKASIAQPDADLGWTVAVRWNNGQMGPDLGQIILTQPSQPVPPSKFSTVRIAFSEALTTGRSAPNAFDRLRGPGLVGLTTLQLLDEAIERRGTTDPDRYNSEGVAQRPWVGHIANGLWLDLESRSTVGAGGIEAATFQARWAALAWR